MEGGGGDPSVSPLRAGVTLTLPPPVSSACPQGLLTEGSKRIQCESMEEASLPWLEERAWSTG